MKSVSIYLSIYLSIVLITLLSCNKEEKLNESNEIKQIQYSCANSNCVNSIPTGCSSSFYDCANHFMNNQSVQNFTINWSYCNSDPQINDPDCHNYIPTITSNLKLCWVDCSTLQAEITNLPPCLPCLLDPFCINLTPDCSTNNSYVLHGTDGNQNELTIEMVIYDDPNITLSCVSGSGQNATTYECNGYY